MRDLKKQLKNLKHGEVNPRQEWLEKNRGLLLSQIRNTVMPAEEQNAWEKIWFGASIFLPKRFVFNFVRPLAVLFVVAIVGMSGWIATVDASYEALPGDWLYPAKRVMEKTQMAAASLVGATTAETKLHAEFAKRRATEIKKVVQSNDPNKEIKVAGTVTDLKTEMRNASTKLDEIQKTGQTGVAEAAKEVQKNAEQINNVLIEVKADLKADASTSTEAKALTMDIGEAKNLAQDTGVKAMGVMVAKHLEGDTAISKEEVKAAIDKTLESAVSEAAGNKQSVDGVKGVVTAVSKEVLASATSTVAQMTIIVNRTNEASVKTDAAVAVLDQQASAAKGLVASGDLTQAVDMVKQATETTKQVEKLQVTTLNVAQQVLPTPVVATVVKDPSVGVLAATSSTDGVKVIVATTTVPIEPGKLPVVVIVTTTPSMSTTTPATTTKR